MTLSVPTPRHFIDLWRMDVASLRAILDDAHARKAARLGWGKAAVDAVAYCKGDTANQEQEATIFLRRMCATKMNTART